MGQEPRDLLPHLSARHFFGAELRHWRELHDLSQDQLGRLVHLSGDSIGKIEKAQRWPLEGLAEACDAALATGGVLARLWPLVEAQRRNPASTGGSDADNCLNDADSSSTPVLSSFPAGKMTLRVDEEGNVWAQVNRRTFLLGSAAAFFGQAVGVPTQAVAATARATIPESDDPYGFAGFVTQHWPDLRLSRPNPDFGVDWNVLLPDGRSAPGSELALQVLPARGAGGRIRATIDDISRADEFTHRPGRVVVVGADTRGDVPRYFLLEARDLRDRATATRDVAIPAAYELDDLTYGMVWAVANLDDALQADDQVLAETRTDLAAYERLSASAVSREAAPDLNPVGHMWLGSDFCARHILRTLPQLPDLPTFWTRCVSTFLRRVG